MKPASLNHIIFKIKQVVIRQATQDEDFRGADVFLNDLAVAARKRSIKLSAFEEISIRKRDFSTSEYEKILDGECLARLWLFEFDDAYILCLTDDIRDCLLAGRANYVHNKDEPNGAYYIHISQIPHLRIDKGG